MRKTKHVPISNDSRDNGKVYLLTEMPASKAEKWAARAFLAMSRSGIEAPEDMMGSGMAGLAVYGIQSLLNLRFEEAEGLLDEMMACVQICPNQNDRSIVRPLIESDIEEVATRLHLRLEIFTLHTGFSMADLRAMSTSQKAAGSSATPTSQGQSEPSSQAA